MFSYALDLVKRLFSLQLTEQEAVLISFVSLVLICICLFWIFHFVSISHINYVKETSRRLSALLELNQKYTNFKDGLEPVYYMYFNVNSKPKYDSFNFNENVKARISQDKERYLDILNRIKFNELENEHYIKELEQLPLSPSKEEVKISLKKYCKIEERLINENTLHPIIDTILCADLQYTSPKGNNHYHSQYRYDSAQIRTLIDEIEQHYRYMQTKAYQRSIMSDSLRYDILKRDGFRCVLCGRTASDGVKLHVDHIQPISKGGKTVPANLRTLCDQCNIGKSNKWENGPD